MRRGAAVVIVLALSGGCAVPAPPASPPTVAPAPGAAPDEAPPAPPTPPDPGSRAGIVCTGQQELRLEGKVIDTPGAAIAASDQCRLTIVHGRLRGGDVGVRASGSARVVVEDTMVQGGRRAISISDHAVIETRGTAWTGGIEASGDSHVLDQGDNTWSR
jgi:hypothetical protein